MRKIKRILTNCQYIIFHTRKFDSFFHSFFWNLFQIFLLSILFGEFFFPFTPLQPFPTKWKFVNRIEKMFLFSSYHVHKTNCQVEKPGFSIYRVQKNKCPLFWHVAASNIFIFNLNFFASKLLFSKIFHIFKTCNSRLKFW